MTSPVVGSTILLQNEDHFILIATRGLFSETRNVAVELVIIPDSSGFRALLMVNTGADSPSFFMVNVNSIFEPKLAFVALHYP